MQRSQGDTLPPSSWGSFHSAAAFPYGSHFSSVSQSPGWSGMYGFISAVLEFHWISTALKQESIFEIHQGPISFRIHEVSISQNANVEVCVVYMWVTLWSASSGRYIFAFKISTSVTSLDL